MKLGWFHIIGSRRFSRMVLQARRSGYEEEHRVSTRLIGDLLHENALLRLRLGKGTKVRKRA